MARPIQIDDERLLAAAEQTLLSEGPADFTLAKAAAVAGVSAATFIKRFGSRDALFLRLSQRWVGAIDDQLEQAVRPYASPLARLRVAALHSYHDLDHPETASKQLATLAIDLQNDELRELLGIGWSRVRRHVARHAAEAVDAGELAERTSSDQLARIVMSAMEGGALAWSVEPDGSLIDRLSADLDALLDGWAPSPRPQQTRRST